MKKALESVGRGLSNSAGGLLNRDFAAGGGGSATDASCSPALGDKRTLIVSVFLSAASTRNKTAIALKHLLRRVLLKTQCRLRRDIGNSNL